VRLAITVADQDVVVDADEAAEVRAVAAELARATGTDAEGLWLDGRRLDDSAAWSEVGLVDGSVVGLGGPAAVPPRPGTAGWQLHVVAGPDGGGVLDVPVGRHELGRSGPMALQDRSVSRRHALLELTPRGATLLDLGSSNGTFVEGERVGTEEPVPVGLGDVIALGDTLVVLRAAAESDAAVEPGPDGTRSYVRQPRLLPAVREARVTLPSPPHTREARRFPLAYVLAPLALGVLLALVMQRPMYLVFALASPALMLVNLLSDRKESAREAKRELERYEADLAAARTRISEALAEETARRREQAPDAATAVLAALLPTRRLWERRRTDLDALRLRVGTGDLASALVIRHGREEADARPDVRTLRSVPAEVSLREIGVLGVAGPALQVLGSLRWLVVQLAVLHAPRDLALTLLAPRSRSDWSWVRWLPHLRPAGGDGPTALVGNDAETTASRVAELVALVKARQELVRSTGRIDASHFPAHVLVVDGVRALRTTPGLAQVLEDGPAVGVYAVCADEEARYLPETCRATFLVSDDGATATLTASGHDPVPDLVVEQLGERLAASAARALAPLRDVTDDEEELALPDSARLLDVVGLEPPTAEAVRARWLLQGRTTSLLLGAGLDGPFALDLVKDGPHALVAGTTGSGKSELLQSIIASLAIVNRPDAMTFVLVDYKGGSAFKDCVRLPHTVGMVTDLDAHLVERALASLAAELKTREHWLADAGVKDIEDYDDLRSREPHREPLPRLLIVIDEFASMARELPDFVTGLVSIAQRGRSLGIHLILATQRPSGVVSPEIRANTNLRISLRVTDAADSTDVLESAEAARIPKSAPGRGFARLGHGALVPFQAGRVGGRRPGLRPAHTPTPFVEPVGWHQLGYTAPAPPPRAQADDGEVTDLAVLVEAVREAARLEGVPAQRSPWLPALPERLLVSEVEPVAVPVGAELPPLLLGRVDEPAAQRQSTAVLDLAADGHLLLIGSARSGRSQALRTLAASAAASCSVADLHLYGLDCGNGALNAVAALPHCGAVVARTQTERAVRLLERLAGELERRQALLSERGFADVGEQRKASPEGERLPRLLLLLDRWEGFTGGLGEVDGGRLTEVVMTLLREGASAGVHVVITGDRSLATGRISSLTENKVALKLADKADYAFVGLSPRDLPDTIPPGRGFTAQGLELQVALLAPDESGQGQAAALEEVAAAARQRSSDLQRGLRPFRVDVLPSRVSYEEAWSMRPEGASPLFALVGVGGDDLTALGPDFSRTGRCFLVGGPAKSGRSTLLSVLSRSLLDGAQARLLVCAPRGGPLLALEGHPQVTAVLRDASTPEATWRELLGAPGPLVVVVDDGESLRDSPGADPLRSLVRGDLGEDRYLVLGGSAEALSLGMSGFHVEARSSRQGVLLSPQGSGDGELLSLRLPRGAVGGPVQLGRGLLHLGDGRLVTVAVPTAP
jgi:DNA segregation ATPase FtsK/SpoIIIE, S-DNA-T family